MLAQSHTACVGLAKASPVQQALRVSMEIIQSMEEIITFVSFSLLLATSIYIFLKVNRIIGLLIFSFASVAILFSLAFWGFPGLEFIADALTEFEVVDDKVIPSKLGGTLGLISSISRLFLAIAIIMLVKHAKNS